MNGIALVLFAGFFGRLAAAQVSNTQDSKPSVVSTAPPTPQRPSDVKVPLLDQPLKLSDFAGMKLRPELKDKVGEITGFIQQVPMDGRPATEKTEVYLGHTRSTLYAVFLCFDDHASLIRSHLARRENVLNDDNVSLLLDPFQDRRRGVMFIRSACRRMRRGRRTTVPITAMTRCGIRKDA